MSDFFDNLPLSEEVWENGCESREQEEGTKIVVSFCPNLSANLNLNKLVAYIMYSSNLESKGLDTHFTSSINNGIVILKFSDATFIDEEYGVRNLFKRICDSCQAESVSVTTKIDGRLDCITFQNDEFDKKWKDTKKSFEKRFSKLKINKDRLEFIDIEKDIMQFKNIYRSEGLVMRNIDSDIKLDDNLIKYTSQLTTSWLSSMEDISIPLPNDTIFRIMHYPDMIPDIPILLTKELPSYEERWEGIEHKGYLPKGKVLGYYTRNGQPLCNGPHIVLSPENIEEFSKSSSVPFNVLFAMVLVHELAHAMMDKYRIHDNDKIMYTIEKENWPNSLEAKAIEESLANAITLACFKIIASEDYKFVSHFVNNWQSTLYRFGLWQESANVDWRFWRETTKQPTDALKKWFDTCFQEGNIRILMDDYSQEDYKKALGI